MAELAVSPGPQQGGKWSNEISGYSLLLIWLVGFFVFTLGPTLASIYLSFTDYDLARPPYWVGLDNYQRIFNAPQFSTAAVTAQVQGFSGATPYVRWGNAPALALCAVMLALGAAAGRRLLR